MYEYDFRSPAMPPSGVVSGGSSLSLQAGPSRRAFVSKLDVALPFSQEGSEFSERHSTQSFALHMVCVFSHSCNKAA